MPHALTMLRFPAAVPAALLLTISPAVDTASAALQPTAAVQIANFTFKAQLLSVKPGTMVTWTNVDDIPHTVTSTSGLFKSKVLDSGDKFSFTFANPGQFRYFCSLHPHMTGTIVVKA